MRYRAGLEGELTIATIAAKRPGKISVAPERYDRFLAAASLVLMGFVIAAIARGRAEWAEVPPVVWGHIVTILLVLALTPVMMLRRRGDRLHRRLGWLWGAALFLTAAMTFGIRIINEGNLSLIHILSAWTMIQVPVIVLAARRHQHAKHRSAVRGMVTGALLIAGFFTFPFDRLMGNWLFG